MFRNKFLLNLQKREEINLWYYIMDKNIKQILYFDSLKNILASAMSLSQGYNDYIQWT